MQSHNKKTKAKSKLRRQNLRKTIVFAILHQENQNKIKVAHPIWRVVRIVAYELMAVEAAQEQIHKGFE